MGVAGGGPGRSRGRGRVGLSGSVSVGPRVGVTARVGVATSVGRDGLWEHRSEWAVETQAPPPLGSERAYLWRWLWWMGPVTVVGVRLGVGRRGLLDRGRDG